jgi:hypothetical protein
MEEMARNQFAGACKDCGQQVEAGAGYFHKMPRGAFPKWAVRCITCVATGKAARGDSLSHHQRQALSNLGDRK